jgi:hypothetical protein
MLVITEQYVIYIQGDTFVRDPGLSFKITH